MSTKTLDRSRRCTHQTSQRHSRDSNNPFPHLPKPLPLWQRISKRVPPSPSDKASRLFLMSARNLSLRNPLGRWTLPPKLRECPKKKRANPLGFHAAHLRTRSFGLDAQTERLGVYQRDKKTHRRSTLTSHCSVSSGRVSLRWRLSRRLTRFGPATTRWISRCGRPRP
jgi:hypothetical protein